jgi:carbon monoxide dehydrogenase subunit G
MTFEHSGTVTTTAPPAAVWKLWSDVATWATWDPGVDDVSLDGPFAVGASGTLTLRGGIEAPFTLEVVEPDARYLDQLTIGELVIRIDHLVRATPAARRSP